MTDLVVDTLCQLGFEIRSVVNAFGTVTVEICTCPIAEIAVEAPEVVRGIQQGLIQEVIDANVDSIGGAYSVAVRPDAHQGSCEVRLEVRPTVKGAAAASTMPKDLENRGCATMPG